MELTSTRQAKARSEMYQGLCALFCEPEDELFSEKHIFRSLRNAFELLQPGQVGLVDVLLEKCTKYSNRELLVDYTKIFLGPFEAIAYPYSSMYYGDKGLMTDVTSWVENFYRFAGLQFDFSIRDLPDHIVVELEFMYHLAFKEWEARSEERMDEAAKFADLQKEFVLRHLSVWGAKMSDAIIESEKNEFYSALAKLFKAFLLHDKMAFASSPN